MRPPTKPRWLSIARILALVLLAVSPRALLAPAASFNRSQESKRPKTPKNVVPNSALRVANAERPGKGPKPAQPDLPFPAERGWVPRLVVDRGLPPKAFTQLTKPDYLKPSTLSIPQSQTSPPA